MNSLTKYRKWMAITKESLELLDHHKRRCVFYHSTAQRRVIDLDTALRQDLLEVTIGHGVPQIEEDGVRDHISGELRTFERHHGAASKADRRN